MRSRPIANTNRFTPPISIKMNQLLLLQIRLTMYAIPTKISHSSLVGEDMIGNKSKSVSSFLLAHCNRSSMTFIMNFMKLSASSVNPRRMKA